MAEFGKKKNRRIPISKNDIKKAIKNANDKLKKQNSKLELDLSDKKASINSINERIEEYNGVLKSLERGIKSANKSSMEARELSTKELANLSRAKTEYSKLTTKINESESNLEKSNKELKKLRKNILDMENKLSESANLKIEIKDLQSNKKKESKDLSEIKSEANGIKKELSKLRTESIEKKEDYKELLDKIDAEVKIKEKSLSTIDKDYEMKIAELNTKMSALKEAHRDRQEQVDILGSIIKKKEAEYIDIEMKCKQAENTLIHTKEMTDKEIEREKSEKAKIREKHKIWRTAVVEEIARLKLKNKIEKIDTAGLSEILNG